MTSSAIELYGRSNTSRTFLARTSSVKGFFRKATSAVQNAPANHRIVGISWLLEEHP